MQKKFVRKYRKSIVKSMSDEKVKKFGFDDSYRRFESSINRMQKEGDYAEELAVQYLKKKELLSDNYVTNKVIALNLIKIEADIIDYDNKVVYETKSRRDGETARKAIKEKWRIFEYDKKNSNYEDFTFVGIIVANYEQGPKVKGLAHFNKATINHEKMKLSFDDHFDRIKYFRDISPEGKKGYYIKKKKKQSQNNKDNESIKK